MIHDLLITRVVARQVAKIAVDGWKLQRGAGEESRTLVVDVVDEEAAHRAWEDVREQEPMGIDYGAPCLSHATGDGEVADRESAEDVGERVVWKGFRRIHGFSDPHADRRLGVLESV